MRIGVRGGMLVGAGAGLWDMGKVVGGRAPGWGNGLKLSKT